MKFPLLMMVWALLGCSLAHAQTDVLIESTAARGAASGVPVFMRAILVSPQARTDTAVLFFRGVPGYAKIQSVNDKLRNMIAFVRAAEPLLLKEGVALVIMDCPTDQWGEYGGPTATSCLDDYRSSKQHVEDVRGVMAKLRQEHGLSKFFIMGHSMGTLSSRWLAAQLGTEIAGSIHSAAVNVANQRGHYRSALDVPYDAIRAPVLHIHNEADACRGTPYAMVKRYAGNNLVTVRGGIPEGNPCGAGHLHSYQGIEALVAQAIVAWIKTGKVESQIGP